MKTLKEIIAALSEQQVRELLEDAARCTDYVAERLAEIDPDANRALADQLLKKSSGNVWETFCEENDESQQDHYGFYEFQCTCFAIEREVKVLLDAGLPDKALELIDECEEEMPPAFIGECKDDIEPIYSACEDARKMVKKYDISRILEQRDSDTLSGKVARY